jgi:ribonuclease HI
VDFQLIYTDGSRKEDGVGASFVHDDFHRKLRLMPDTSNYVAEMTALYAALEYVQTLPVGKFAMVSDSLSTLQRLSVPGYKSGDPALLSGLRYLLISLRSQGFSVCFLWCPSHKGIEGNECADRLAKDAVSTGEPSMLSAEVHGLLSELRESKRALWQERWDTESTGRYTFSLLPQVPSESWFRHVDLPRSVIVTNSRIMLNHNRLNCHLNRFNIVESALCSCGEDYETVDHVLWCCPLRENGRSDFNARLINLGLITGDTRSLYTQKSFSPEIYIRIHTFLRRHDVRL